MKSVFIFKGITCDVTLTDERGEFESPGYQNGTGTYDYAMNWTLCISITDIPGRTVHFDWDDFDVEYYSDCLYDALEVRDFIN